MDLYLDGDVDVANDPMETVESILDVDDRF
jgi:hypothetical protein